MAKQYFVYMMSNAGKTVLYTGVTSNLLNRVYEHKHNLKGKFTQRYNCNTLVYFEETNLADAAITREKQIKGLSRVKKDALVNSMNPKWKDLSEGWYS
jgi:putative endonuclease